MKGFLAIILLFALAAPATAARRRKRPTKRRAAIAKPCPPPVVRIIPDRVEVVTQSEEDSLQAAIAAWMRGQPEMSEAAANKAREIAAVWFRRGKRAAGK